MTENPYTPPQTSPQAVDSNTQFQTVELASKLSRLGAVILDIIILFIVLIPVLLILIILGIFSDGPSDASFLELIGNLPDNMITDIISGLLGIIVYVAINGYLLAKSGQSIGKKILGIKIVDYHTNQLLPASRVIGTRYVLNSLITLVPSVGNFYSLVDALFIFSRDQRCIHDLIANSKVIKAR